MRRPSYLRRLLLGAAAAAGLIAVAAVSGEPSGAEAKHVRRVHKIDAFTLKQSVKPLRAKKKIKAKAKTKQGAETR